MVPELTFDMLVSTFSEELVSRPSPASVPSAVTHEATRDFLTRVGLPLELRNGAVDLEDLTEGWESLPELWEDVKDAGWSWTMPERPDHWFSLGNIFGYGLIVFDGETGQVWTIPEDDDAPMAPLHSGVDALAYYMYAIERDRRLYGRTHALAVDSDPADPRDEDDVYMEAARNLANELHAADPTPFVNGPGEAWEDDGEGPWAWIFRDISEGAWSSD